MRVIAVGDAHIEPGQSLAKFKALGNYAARHRVDHVVLLGDFVTMQSLSSYEGPGTEAIEGLRIREEVECGAMALAEIRLAQRSSHKRLFRLHYIEGNHEERIKRWVAEEPRLGGLVSLQRQYAPWIDSYTPYRHTLELDGVMFTHVPFNRTKAVSGVFPAYRASLLVSRSMVFGHTHKIGVVAFGKFGDRNTNLSINAGCFFEEEYDPDYMDGRIKEYWRGIFDLDIKDGNIRSFNMISLDALKEDYL